MTTLATILVAWCLLSVPVGIVMGRLLGRQA